MQLDVASKSSASHTGLTARPKKTKSSPNRLRNPDGHVGTLFPAILLPDYFRIETGLVVGSSRPLFNDEAKAWEG